MSDSETEFSSDYEEDEYDDDGISEGDGNVDADEAKELREQLQDVPLGEIKKLKDQVGLKRYNQVLFGLKDKNEDGINGDGDLDDGVKGDLKSKQSLKRKNNEQQQKFEKRPKKKSKSEPTEMSSKKKKFNHDQPRYVVKSNKRSTRDPRFNDLSGAYNEELFEKSYAFVQDIKKNEYESVKTQLKKVRNTEEKEKLLKVKQKMDTELKVKAEKEKKRELFKKQKQQVSEQTKIGKKAFYLKNSDKKKIELAEKYKELKSSGKLDKYMMKKRKRNAQKDKRSLPKMKNPTD